ncbi:MAG: energy transducer TonB [Candidatus Nitrohelix vancouverensis]|uniref:Energy transducer TonB n=1 Tax=Candidatus Nitrohelix vancouverensis TaxID=2705534 RepID=A0A7T0C191_9BACT|nr:MAG: energy transducer TonB [Candidatus Nitrohelix vancouverensis]
MMNPIKTLGMLFRISHITALVSLILSLAAHEVRAENSQAGPDPVAVHYFSQLQRQVLSHWSYPQSAALDGKTGQVEVRVTIDRDGTILTGSVESSSRYRELKQAARDAVKASEPFPPFPASFKEQSIDIRFRFSYLPKDPASP